jgi:TPR repeat protein
MHTRKILTPFFLALAMLVLVAGVTRAESGYAPADAEKTLKSLGWTCMIQALCPLTKANYDTFQRAVEGHRADRYLLGLLLRAGDGFPTDREGGTAWVAMAAEQGAALAVMYAEGHMQNGEHIEFDETKAASILKKQVDAGDIDSMRALGPMLIRGRGVDQNPQAGIDLLKKAAALGSHDAERDLAGLYTLGTNGLPHDRETGMKWYAAAANHGDVDAMMTLGYMWMNAPINDSNFRTDVILGYCWLVRAAMLDKAQAQYELALIFSRGEHDSKGNDMPRDLIQADFWFRLGARNPEYDNSQVRGSVEPNMTTAQTDEAKARVAAWHKFDFAHMKAAKIAASPDGARSCPPME